LARLLRRCNEPAIVFTEYRDTLAHLVAALGARDAAILHGGLDTSERRTQMHRFTHGNARLLFATDAASEGLNLHAHCRFVGTLEAPGTPPGFDQRAGRVARLGQDRRPHVVTLAAKDTFEDRVVTRLVRRLGRARAVVPFGDAMDLRGDAQAETARVS